MRLIYWNGSHIMERARGTTKDCQDALKAWEPTDEAERMRKFNAQIWTEKQANRFKYLDGSHPLRDSR